MLAPSMPQRSPTLPTGRRDDQPELPMTRQEMDSNTGLELPSLGRTLRLFGRALLLRCPNCGKGPVLENWLKLRVKCGNCGLRLQRGEHDSFTGSMFILFTLVGLVAYAVLVVTMLVTDTTPWDLLENGLPVLTIVLLVVLYPFSKLLWLAFDLMLRPVTPEELEWHRTSETEFETKRDLRR
jgi:uncharacterized protein (DUF983 family)